jgi:hypothetical protein
LTKPAPGRVAGFLVFRVCGGRAALVSAASSSFRAEELEKLLAGLSARADRWRRGADPPLDMPFGVCVGHDPNDDVGEGYSAFVSNCSNAGAEFFRPEHVNVGGAARGTATGWRLDRLICHDPLCTPQIRRLSKIWRVVMSRIVTGGGVVLSKLAQFHGILDIQCTPRNRL